VDAYERGNREEAMAEIARHNENSKEISYRGIVAAGGQL
jgi:hypothetical protein